ncbi:MAG TPA: fibronectin type III domain-containing protein, partial [Candidatus Lokiarchaeia archaeon]|nr:fibronectin type III domain-containing protein [Candidatus Lokiarchaeia archaeon]
NSGRGIYLQGASTANPTINVTVTGNTCADNTGENIEAYFSNNTSVIGNNCSTACPSGFASIDFQICSNFTVIGNNATGAKYSGIRVNSVPNVLLSGNNCSKNGEYGIDMYSSNNGNDTGINATGNFCAENTLAGIYADGGLAGGNVVCLTFNDSITNNTITNNKQCGIWLTWAVNNTIANNTISGNPKNVYFDSVTNNNNLTDNCGLDFATPAITAPGGLVQFNNTIRSVLSWSYNWSFGDGTLNSAIQNATHTFTSVGSFNVVVFANDSANDNSTDHLTIVVSGQTPQAPQSLQATPGDGQVTLSWQTPSVFVTSIHPFVVPPRPSADDTSITGYNFYRGTSAGGEILVHMLGVVTSYSDSGLTNGVTYYYQVSAVNGAGEGPRSNEISATPSASTITSNVPSVPRNITATSGNGQIFLNWSVPASDGGSAITGYKIYRGVSPGQEILYATLGNVTIYTDTNVTNGQIYYYNISAVNANGEGPRGNEVNATPNMPVDFHVLGFCLCWAVIGVLSLVAIGDYKRMRNPAVSSNLRNRAKSKLRRKPSAESPPAADKT